MKFLFETFANNQNTSSVSSMLRKKRFALFIETLSVKSSDRILDVGGTEHTWNRSGLENRVTILNLKFERHDPRYSYICGDACNMHMIKNKEFDIVFSNSVIEHVGQEKQKLFANEVLRVGIKYWIQTPYKHFPVESHFVFPFFQYLPKYVQRRIALKWPYSNYFYNGNRKEEILWELERLKLLTISEMKYLFQDSRIIYEKYFGIVKSIIAYKSP